MTNSFGSHEENGWRRGEMGGGGRDGGGFDEEAQGGVKAGEGARQRGRVIDEKKKKGIECERGGEGDGQSGRRGDRSDAT